MGGGGQRRYSPPPQIRYTLGYKLDKTQFLNSVKNMDIQKY